MLLGRFQSSSQRKELAAMMLSAYRLSEILWDSLINLVESSGNIEVYGYLTAGDLLLKTMTAGTKNGSLLAHTKQVEAEVKQKWFGGLSAKVLCGAVVPADRYYSATAPPHNASAW